MNETTRAVLYAAVKEQVREALGRRAESFRVTQQGSTVSISKDGYTVRAEWNGKYWKASFKPTKTSNPIESAAMYGQEKKGIAIQWAKNILNDWINQPPLGESVLESGKQYVLTKDGKEVMRGTEFEIMAYVHQKTSSSFDWALKYEGYKVKPVGQEAIQEARVPYEVEKAVRWMSRKDMQDLLENYGFAVYERESDKELEDAIIANIEDGVIDQSEVL